MRTIAIFAAFFVTLYGGFLSVHAQSPSPSATPSAQPAIPTLTVQAASGVGATSATLNGTITSLGGSNVTERGFEYGLTTSYTNSMFNFGTFNTGTYSLTGSFTCGTTYHYRAYARNSFGLGVSSDSTFTTSACPSPTPSASPSPTPSGAPDTTPPTVSITAPANNSNYTSAQIIMISTSASDNVAVTRVDFYRGATLISQDSTSPFTAAWAVNSSNNGSYNLTARAYDAAGNTQTSAPVSITINIASPSPSPTPSASPSPTPAPQAVIPLRGWAWSSNVGWISFSSANATAMNANGGNLASNFFKLANAAGGPYGVTMSTSTSQPLVAQLSGYAWSSNVGWIKFGGLSGYPAGGTGTDAQVELAAGATRGRVTGWARACAGTLPGDCSNMQPRTDGWDGWIELSGVNHVSPDPALAATPTPSPSSTAAPVPSSNQGVYLDPNTGYFSGYAWGSDVVGWVKFNPTIPVTGGQGVNVGDCNVLGTCPGSGTFSITCEMPDEAIITSGDTVTVTRSVTYRNGTAPYTLVPATLVLSQGTYNNVLVTANDSASHTATASCGSINVVKPDESNLQLLIGRNAGMAEVHDPNNPLKVKVGSLFKLQWFNTLPVYDPVTETGYLCQNVINPGVNSWKDPWDNAPGNTVTGLSANQTGLYQFTISCEYPSNQSLSANASAFLKVVNVSEGEI